jgi:hypothetical protein
MFNSPGKVRLDPDSACAIQPLLTANKEPGTPQRDAHQASQKARPSPQQKRIGRAFLLIHYFYFPLTPLCFLKGFVPVRAGREYAPKNWPVNFQNRFSPPSGIASYGQNRHL